MTATWEDWRIEDERQCSPGLKVPPMTSEIEVLKTRQAALKVRMDAERAAKGHTDAWDTMAGQYDDLGDQIGELEIEESRRTPARYPWSADA